MFNGFSDEVIKLFEYMAKQPIVQIGIAVSAVIFAIVLVVIISAFARMMSMRKNFKNKGWR